MNKKKSKKVSHKTGKLKLLPKKLYTGQNMLLTKENR